MDLSSLLSFQTLFLSLGIGVVVQTIKNIAEAKFPSLSSNKNWGKVWIPSLSLVVGVVLVQLVSIQPEFMNHANFTDRCLAGLIAGFISSYAFRALKSIMIKEGGADE